MAQQEMKNRVGTEAASPFQPIPSTAKPTQKRASQVEVVTVDEALFHQRRSREMRIASVAMPKGTVEGVLRSLRRRVLAVFARAEGPAAWILLIGGLVTFLGVLMGLFTVGDAKLATLLVAADLFVGGFSAVQEHEDDEDQE